MRLGHEAIDGKLADYDPIGKSDVTNGSITQADDEIVHGMGECRRSGIERVAITDEEICERGDENVFVRDTMPQSTASAGPLGCNAARCLIRWRRSE